MTNARRISRRSLLISGTGLSAAVMVGCGSDDDAGPATTVEATEPEATQIPPTPTQQPIASPVPGYLDPNRWAGRTLTIASPALGDDLGALSQAFFDAFVSATGANVRHQELGREGVESLIDQVENSEVVWDVVLIPTEDVLPLSQVGVLAAVDYNVVDATALYPEITMQHGVGARMYSTVLVYPVQSTAPPTDWTDFWDLSQELGTRALRRSPVGTLEFALMADGVAMPDLYPLDTVRAFASLERIRTATQFWEDSKTPVEFVRTGQVGYASAWSVRTDLPDVASLVTPQWNGGMISADSWTIPRGAPNGDVAQSFLNFATRAVTTANYTTLRNFGPVNSDALAFLRDDIVAGLPNSPEHLAVQFFENWGYWAEYRESLRVQFEDWLLNPVSTPIPG